MNATYNLVLGEKIYTEDAINELCNKIQQLNNDECKYTIRIFFDLAGAFDNLWWPALMTEIKNLKIHTKIGKLLKTIFVIEE